MADASYRAACGAAPQTPCFSSDGGGEERLERARELLQELACASRAVAEALPALVMSSPGASLAKRRVAVVGSGAGARRTAAALRLLGAEALWLPPEGACSCVAASAVSAPLGEADETAAAGSAIAARASLPVSVGARSVAAVSSAALGAAAALGVETVAVAATASTAAAASATAMATRVAFDAAGAIGGAVAEASGAARAAAAVRLATSTTGAAAGATIGAGGVAAGAAAGTLARVVAAAAPMAASYTARGLTYAYTSTLAAVRRPSATDKTAAGAGPDELDAGADAALAEGVRQEASPLPDRPATLAAALAVRCSLGAELRAVLPPDCVVVEVASLDVT